MHIVLLQPGAFFDISSLVSPQDKISFVGLSPFFNTEEVYKQPRGFVIGGIRLLSKKLNTLDGLNLVDEFESSIQEIEHLVKDIQAVDGPIDFVLGNLEATILPASIINARLGINSYPPEKIEEMRNKIKMKMVVENDGRIAFPKFIQLDSSKKTNLTRLSEEIGFPMILKPTKQAGSLGVRKLSSFEELSSAINHLENSIEYEAEEFIDGQTIHIDGVIRDNQLLFLAAGEYIISCLSWLKDKKPQGSIFISEEKRITKIRVFTQNVLEAFDFKNGVFHLEAFEAKDTGNLTFLEIAPRFAGGQIPTMYRHLFNIDLAKEGVLSLLGRESEIAEPSGYMKDSNLDENLSAAWIIIPAPPSSDLFSIKSVFTPPDLATVVESSIPDIDSVITVPTTNIYFSVASFHLKGSQEKVQQDVQTICTEFKFESETITRVK